jgi:uncharacterized iron-regulated protein
MRGPIAVALLLLSQAIGPAARSAPPLVLGPASVILLGEIHDNAEGHAIRLEAFRAWLATGARPALLLEQFDRERQADLDRARAGPVRPEPERLVEAAGGATGWKWSFYEPLLALALEHDLPIVAANVSRTDTRAIVERGLAASGFDAAVPADILGGQAQAIVASHCGMVDEALARRLALAQIARDQFMARLIERHATRGAVLIAGAGHVRTDIGVPRWLPSPLRDRSESIGFVEEGSGNAPFDRVVVLARQDRPDLCAGMKPGLKR